MRIVNIDPTGASRIIPDVGEVAHGADIEVDADLGERLLEQTDVWARPTTKAAKTAAKEGS